MDIKKPLLVKVEAFIYAFVYSCVRSSATPSATRAAPDRDSPVRASRFNATVATVLLPLYKLEY